MAAVEEGNPFDNPPALDSNPFAPTADEAEEALEFVDQESIEVSMGGVSMEMQSMGSSDMHEPLQREEGEDDGGDTSGVSLLTGLAASHVENQAREALGMPAKESKGPSCRPSCCTLSFYQPYFNVSTTLITNRLLRALFPPLWKLPFYDADELPDLYGPFWLCTTLMLFLTVSGNFIGWIYFSPTDRTTEWKADFELVGLAAGLFYSTISVIPLLMWVTCRALGTSRGLFDTISLYGYSLSYLLPASLLCAIPSEIVQWTIMSLTCLLSTAFLLRNLAIGLVLPEDEASPPLSRGTRTKGTIVLVVAALIRIAICLTVKLKFYY